MIIAVDFDGTCVTHEFPDIGTDIGAVPVLKDLVDAGHQLILFTMRSNVLVKPTSKSNDIYVEAGNYLADAIEWFNTNGVELWGVQTNPDQCLWTTSPKAYAHMYIDDAALGCPLVYGEADRPYVDWHRVRKMCVELGLLETETNTRSK